MRLIGNLKKRVEATGSTEEAKEVIAQAGMELNDDELDKVSGGREQHEVQEIEDVRMQQNLYIATGHLGTEEILCPICGNRMLPGTTCSDCGHTDIVDPFSYM